MSMFWSSKKPEVIDLSDDEDELIQFPPYGSANHDNEDLEKDSGWLNWINASKKPVEEAKTPEPSPIDWDMDEQMLWKQRQHISLDRELWMPDDFCKHCYACEITFTMFRRRHHCRICGQVFCNSCSAFFLGNLRVCQSCFQKSTQKEEPSRKVESPKEPVPQNPLDKQRLQGNRHLGLTAAAHLEKLTIELLKLRIEDVDPAWVNKLLTLATRVCATVSPSVKKGDLLDIRPYCKVKVLPGGQISDCAYISGILFRKNVCHQKMAKEIENPKILLIAHSVEFSQPKFHSLETILEQEDTYMDILIGKILKLKPDVIFVGKSVSRKAQELLLKAGVVVVQHVKDMLLRRIARQTNSTVLSNTDQILQDTKLGQCRRFRLVTVRDNEHWDDDRLSQQKNGLKIHQRQALLAANRLGDDVMDGAAAVKAGLAKRGVSNTYVLLEGCPKHLGCSIILRGGDKKKLKQVKTVFRFLANAAYNLRLETRYLRERGARIRPDYRVPKNHTFSSSLCVDYGRPTSVPWNGGNNNEQQQQKPPKVLSALDHQAILVTSIWMTDKTQCCPAEVKGICYYSLQDVALGQFLRDSCFNLSLKCQNPNCKKSVLDHSLSFVHNDGLLNIMVEQMEVPLSDSQKSADKEEVKEEEDDDDNNFDRPIATWTYCKNCRKLVSPLTYISDDTWKYSFGKFLEVFFYNRDAVLLQCSCNLQSCATLYFGCGRLAARFTYERVSPFGVSVRKHLPLDIDFHRREAMRRLDFVSVESSKLFINFEKHIERISNQARSLFNSAMNRPEHLQTVFLELSKIGSEVDHAAQVMQQKLDSVSANCRNNDSGDIHGALFRFPLFARRYLFTLTSAWNEKLSAVGQAISAMKKIAASSASLNEALGPSVTPTLGDPLNEELAEGMKRLKQLIDHYARYNVSDITQVLPSLPSKNSIQNEAQQQEYDADFDDPESPIDFTDGVDADVLASRRRLKTKEPERPTKSLGTRRSVEVSREAGAITSAAPKPNNPGGAVKSALTRLFNRGGRSYDKYVVDLGIFAEGRPRLPPGVDGIVVPVVDDQLSTIIAYSLASHEYAKQFKQFVRMESTFDGGNEGGISTGGQSTSPSAEINAGMRDMSAVNGHMRIRGTNPTSPSPKPPAALGPEERELERRMIDRNKAHIKHTFRDISEKGQPLCKFGCTSYWATQFHALRQTFLAEKGQEEPGTSARDIEHSYIESLSTTHAWLASGGKSGASFSKTADGRFVIKCISRTELQMFLDCAPKYFEYLSHSFFHGVPSIMCKLVGVYQIGVHNYETGKKTLEQVAIMQNIFYKKKISRTFDLKGSLRGRFTATKRSGKDENVDGAERSSSAGRTDDSPEASIGRDDTANSIVDESASDREDGKAPIKLDSASTLLDGDFLEFTMGRPMPLIDKSKAFLKLSILNDTLFLTLINVLDYSILIGVDEENMELVVGIIDFMRQYDILKQMERVGKSIPMVVGSEAPTIIQPPLYKQRFTQAMERYFMSVPSKWTTISDIE